MKKLLALGLLCAFLAILSACTNTTTSYTTDSYSVLGKPSLTASQIDRILCSAKSPACGTGQAFYSGSLTYGIDDAYALAFFQHESTFGKYGVATKAKGIGNIRCQGWQGPCIDGFRAYSSWAEGVDDWYKLIKWYVTDLHKSTVPTIVATYAPSSENDTQGYIQAVNNAVAKWRQGGV
jgi:hypothetical protein